MSVSKWSYDPEKCDYDYCVGDCDYCHKADDDGEEVSVEELIRCKDCIRIQYCNFTQQQGLNGYCSFGERREP